MPRIHSLFVLLAVFVYAGRAHAQPPAVVGFEISSGLFLQSPLNLNQPTELARWILVNDADHACEWRHASWQNSYQDPSGFEIEPADDSPGFYLSRWGTFYMRDWSENQWTVAGNGEWIDPRLGWTKLVGLPSGETATRHLLWQGERSIFFNDPRDTDERSQNWYRIGNDGTCAVFTEVRHDYGPFHLETVELRSNLLGAPTWTLAAGQSGTGQQTEIGNWLY